MRESSVERSEGRWPSLWRILRGPRFVDLPIRAFALVMGLTVFVPGAFELAEPLYVALLVLAYALIVLAPFLPFSVVIASSLLGFAFLWQYPDLENMYPEALVLGTAVLLSYMRWWAFGAATAALLAYQLTATAWGGLDGGVEGLIDLGYAWMTSCLVGLAAGVIERRICSEITRREQAARENERALETMRMRFTSDTHDTISHSLSIEAAIIKSLGRAPQAPGTDRMIAELAMVNAEASKRLRQLVGRLRADAPGASGIALPSEARLLVSAIEDGCAAGGVRLSVAVESLPEHASPVVGEHFTAFLLELATNVIRYSTPGTESRLTVRTRRTGPSRVVLIYASVNEADAPLSAPPRSLSQRARAVGGTCTVGADSAGRVVVEVTHPLELADSAAGIEARCVQDDFAARADEVAGGSAESAAPSRTDDPMLPRAEALARRRSEATGPETAGSEPTEPEPTEPAPARSEALARAGTGVAGRGRTAGGTMPVVERGRRTERRHR